MTMVIDPVTGLVDLTIPDEEHVRIIMATSNTDEATARFMLAMQKGEIDGDVIELRPGDDPDRYDG